MSETDNKRKCSKCGIPMTVKYVFGERKRIYKCPQCNKKIKEKLD